MQKKIDFIKELILSLTINLILTLNLGGGNFRRFSFRVAVNFEFYLVF